MKFIFSSIIAIIFLSLTGCGTQGSDHGSAKKGQSVYTGEIISISKSEKSSILIRVSNVKKINTSNDVGDMILRATAEKLKDGNDSLRVGDRIKIVLIEEPRMTKSLPPIVFLDSLVEVSRIES